MIHIQYKNFDIRQIMDSGQCFRMTQAQPGVYEIYASDRHVRIRKDSEGYALDCSRPAFENFWKNYFDLETDYTGYIKSIDPEDTYLSAAAAYGSGIRILRQDLWEMIITFLISQQNNIIRIRGCIQRLCEHYGALCTDSSGSAYRAFPTPEALAGAGEDALRALRLGYRSKYIDKTAKAVTSGVFDLAAVSRLPYKEARQALTGLCGVGEKVADCICLFGLHHMEAFPIDTHIRKVLSKQYDGSFKADRYQGFQGLIQQYIFYYDLKQPVCGISDAISVYSQWPEPVR